jgi:MbtH protein
MADVHEYGNAFKVVVNHEEQYALWPAGRANPHGWRDAGIHGTREECLAAVARAWADLRPRSLRRQPR